MFSTTTPFFPPSLYKPSFFNLFLSCHILQLPMHPNGFLLDLVQYWEGGKLDAEFQMCPPSRNQLP